MKTVAERYDCVISGAGPGGGLLAYLLSSQGVRVLVLEKETWPRYKPCGGGLTRRARHLIPFEMDDIIEDEVFYAQVALNDFPFFTKKFDKPVISMVMRDRFDRFLMEKAMEKGAELRPVTSFRKLDGHSGHLTVHTSKGKLKAVFVIGADGVNGRTAGALGIYTGRKTMFALEAEVPSPNTVMERYRGQAHFDFGSVPTGYGWVFPKRDHLSVGILTLDQRIKHLRPHLERYCRSKGIPEHSMAVRPHLLPYAPARKNIWANERGLVLGDAAGFTDMITGEGIYFALKQAWMAADVILDALENGPDRMLRYNRLFRKIFMTELTPMRVMQFGLYKTSDWMAYLTRVHGRLLGEHMLRVVSGETSYNRLYRKMFMPKWLWPIIAGRKRNRSCSSTTISNQNERRPEDGMGI